MPVAIVLPVAPCYAGAQHQFVLAPAQREGPAGVGIERIAGGAAYVLAAPQRHAGAVGRVGEARSRRAQVGVVAVDLVVELRLGHPAVAEAVLQRGKGRARVLVPTAPARAVVVRARHVIELAIGIEQRNAAPGGVDRTVVLRIAAQRQQSAWRQVHFHNAVQRRGLARIAVHERVLVLVGGHATRAHAAACIECAAHIHLGAVVAPAARRDGRMPAEITRGLLADQVDGRARSAAAREQAGCALEHLDAVIDRHVAEGVAGRVRGVAHHRNAVVLEVLDGEAAGVVLGALAVIGDDADAGRVLHHLVDGGEVEVIHLLACDHADGLRRLARRQHHARGCGNGARRIGARAFGHLAQLVGDHVDRGQRGRVLRVRQCLSLSGQGADGKGDGQRKRRRAMAGLKAMQWHEMLRENSNTAIKKLPRHALRWVEGHEEKANAICSHYRFFNCLGHRQHRGCCIRATPESVPRPPGSTSRPCRRSCLASLPYLPCPATSLTIAPARMGAPFSPGLPAASKP